MLYKLRKIVNNDFDYYTLRICILIYCRREGTPNVVIN